MEKHITLVAVLHIGFGILGVLGTIVVWVLLVGIGVITGDDEVIAILAVIAPIITAFFLIVSVPGIIGGVGLLKRRPWARILVLIVSVMRLVDIPIGTAIGIYSLWVLMNEETKQLLASGHSS